MIHNVSILFLSVFLESLPFLLLGSFISAIIEEFIDGETISKLIPSNVFFGSIIGIILGFFLPACDCAVIPISKRLIKKKVPLNVAISFMLSSPIINPVVLLSTYYAFYNTNKSLFYERIFLGIIVALIVGIIMGIIFRKKDVLKNGDSDTTCCHGHDCDDEFKELEKYSIHKDSHLVSIFKNTGIDLFEVVKFLIIGDLIASIVQVVLPKSVIILFSNNDILSIIVLMMFAYLISLCSTSDSFVGKSLLSSFSASGILAYLILGPMIDIKNTIVLLGNYKSKFVFTFISLLFIVIFIFCMVVSII